MEKKIEKEASDEVLMREGNISLILDSYDDIFSDFDPRPYEQKALSDDFLVECKRAAEDKQKEIELRLLVPKHRRTLSDEAKIKKRLRSHFQKHYKEKEEEKRKIRMQGVLWSVIGAGLILIATFLYTQTYRGFIFTLFFVLFEPAGWFTMWTGLEKIFIDAEKRLHTLEFYKKMARAKINFYNY